jgi:hypothetical protein
VARLVDSSIERLQHRPSVTPTLAEIPQQHQRAQTSGWVSHHSSRCSGRPNADVNQGLAITNLFGIMSVACSSSPVPLYLF